MDKRLLVVGIDPGATVGYAVLDIDGNILKTGSEKHCTLDEIIKKVIAYGEPIMAGTDKKHPPYFVSQFATKVGARLIFPKKDLLVSDKRTATANSETRNFHELDALAAAVFARNEILPLINKIDNFVKIYGKEGIKERLRKKVILEEINIKDAAEIIEGKHELTEKFVPEKTPDNKSANVNPALEQLKEKNKRYMSDIELLKRYNKKLMKYVKKLKKKLAANNELSQEEIDRRVNNSIYFRNQRISLLLKKDEEKDRVIFGIKESNERLNIILSDLKNCVVIKKLPNLSYNLYERYNRVLNVQHGDILLVENPNEYSFQTVDEIKEKVGVIVYKMQLKNSIREKLPFIFVAADEIDIIEDKFFCAADKKSFEDALKKKNLLNLVVENYKKTRV